MFEGLSETITLGFTIAGSAWYIVKELVKQAASHTLMISKIEYQLESLNTTLMEVKSVLHKEVLPKMDDQHTRITKLETSLMNGKYEK